GSGKKFKRCHGADAAPKLNAPKIDWTTGIDGAPVPPPSLGPAGLGGMNPQALQNMMGQLDPAMLNQFSQTLSKLPKGKLHQLQAVMQAAMAGKDISKEADEFEKTLRPEMQQMFAGMKNLPAMAALAGGGAETPAAEMPKNVDDARSIIENAVAEGKLTR